MKKKHLIIVLAVLLLAILFVPIPSGPYRDGGTVEYNALTYKIVRWKRLHADAVYEKTRVYFGTDRYLSLEELWEREGLSDEFPSCDQPEFVVAKVLEMKEASALVEPIPGDPALLSSDRITFSLSGLVHIGAAVGDVVKVYYVNGIMESSPAQIHAVNWELATDLRTVSYDGVWLDKTTAEAYDNNVFDHIVITRIFSNCFFAKTVIPMPYEIKLNGTLSNEWCVGDQIRCTYENTYYDDVNQRIEADMLSVEQSSWQPDPFAAYKPVIYLYPKKTLKAEVTLDLNGSLTSTYPKYSDGWSVTATPDGILTDEYGKEYNYLYWEGVLNTEYDFSQGFCVAGGDTAAFLEEALSILGLNRREANEFIVYWLPLMETNPYNLISFQSDAYTSAASLSVSPKPDTVIRVFMAWKPLQEYREVPEQILSSPEREGFTVVEWGGCEVK